MCMTLQHNKQLSSADTREIALLSVPAKITGRTMIQAAAGHQSVVLPADRYLRCQQDVLYNAKLLGHDLEHTSYFQYMYHNGPNSLYMGYVWSLDVFVDYACKQLGTLGNVLLVLLILEVVVVQFIGMLYEFVILRAANVEAMKRFSVFLALPSAVMRVMASKQLQVSSYIN